MSALKLYTIEVRSKYPAYLETPGIIELYAKSAKDAIRLARHEMWRSGHTRMDGPIIYRNIPA